MPTKFEALLKLHPYSSSYLTAIVNRDGVHTGLELISYAYGIDQWLSENCLQQATKHGFYSNHYYPTYMWGNTYAPLSRISPLGYSRLHIETYTSIQLNGRSSLCMNDFSNSVDIATKVHFKFEQDLLAFRLRWGINE